RWSAGLRPGCRRRGDDEVAPAGEPHAEVDIVGEEEALVDELLGRRLHRRLVGGDARIALLERGPGVAQALPLLGGAGERHGRAEVVDDLPGSTAVAVSGVEA